jgi:hypothetical protein
MTIKLNNVMVQWCIKDIKISIYRNFILYINHTYCMPTTASNTSIILWKMLNCANQLKFSQQWLWKVPSSVKPQSLMGIQRCFEATYCLQIKGSKVSQANNLQAASITTCLTYSLTIQYINEHQPDCMVSNPGRQYSVLICLIDRLLLKRIIGMCVVFKVLETDTSLLQPVFKYIFVTFHLCTLLQWPCLY